MSTLKARVIWQHVRGLPCVKHEMSWVYNSAHWIVDSFYFLNLDLLHNFSCPLQINTYWPRSLSLLAQKSTFSPHAHFTPAKLLVELESHSVHVQAEHKELKTGSASITCISNKGCPKKICWSENIASATWVTHRRANLWFWLTFSGQK